MNAPAADLAKAPYPMGADQQIRQAAALLPWDLGVIRTLDMIRTQLFGDAEKAQRFAQEWAQCAVMADSREEIQNAKNNLAGLWEGAAFQQFDQYSGSVVVALNTNHAAVTAIGRTVGEFVQIVYDNYAAAIKFMGDCAADLAGLMGYGGLAVLTVYVPGVDLVTLGVFLTKLVDTLSAFVKNVNNLIVDAVSKVGTYKTSATSLLASANSFQVPSIPGGEVGHTSSWVPANRNAN
ncbi:hypothetical protein [Saccharopolyspora sp. 5N708]|uniref:hypothetical protein n=1 Tax=Saccharopolyspora sp. 5N708 TaxID=3457424 RepID=UPI003FD18270